MDDNPIQVQKYGNMWFKLTNGTKGALGYLHSKDSRNNSIFSVPPNKIIAYVWIDNKSVKGIESKIPDDNENHGLINIHNNADKLKSFQHIVYIDRLNEGKFEYQPTVTLGGINVPLNDNVVIRHISLLWADFKELAEARNV